MRDNLLMDLSTVEIPLAHVTHWLASLLYLVPVVVLAGGIVWQRRQDAARRDSEPAASDGESPGEEPTE